MSEPDPFAGTAAHYARARPDYGEDAIEYLRDRFGLEDARVLDLGCGTGQLAVPLAAHAGTVLAMDPNAGMLQATAKRAAETGRTDVETLQGSDEDLRAGLIEEIAPLDLTTMGRSFHWMDGRPTVDCLREHTRSGGGVAIVHDPELVTGGSEPWTAAVYDALAGFLEEPPERYDPETVEYEDPWDELLAERGLADVETATFDVLRSWSVDGIVDYVRSLSFASPAHDDGDAVEAAIRAALAERGGGPFEQSTTVSVIAGRVP